MDEKNLKFMKAAIKLALKAESMNEVPIGSVVVSGGKIIGRGYNKRESSQSATAHAEITAINKACKKLNSWRLDNAELYVTLEPCPMCAGAIVNARIKKVYFGAYEKKSGCACSKHEILTDNGMNHKTDYEGGIMEEECSKLLKDYFKAKRAKNNLK